jgi:hypothetical protein
MRQLDCAVADSLAMKTGVVLCKQFALQLLCAA